ncbi:MAG: hypothetical protein ACQEP3_03170 [Patescibacteria group bacterium]
MKTIETTKEFFNELGVRKAIKACNFEIPIQEKNNSDSSPTPINSILVNPYEKTVHLKERCPVSGNFNLGSCACKTHNSERVFDFSIEEAVEDIRNIYGDNIAHNFQSIMD